MKLLSTLFSSIYSKLAPFFLPKQYQSDPTVKAIIYNLLSIACAITLTISIVWGMTHWTNVREETAYSQALAKLGPPVVTIGNTTYIRLNPPILDKRNHRYTKIELMQIIHRFETNNNLRIISWQEDRGQNVVGFEMQLGLDLVHQPVSQPTLSLALGNLESLENKRTK